MKKPAKVIIWILAAVLAVFLILDVIFLLFGKTIVSGQIEKTLKLKASLGSLTVGFPLTVSFKDLEIKDLIKADSISLSPSLLGLLAGKVVLNNLAIERPVITVSRDAQGKFNLPVLDQKGKQPPILMAGLRINNGRFIFSDKKISQEGYQVIVDKINVDISKVTLPPTSLYTNFKVSAILLDREGNPAGEAGLNGWIDFGPKDMDGRLELKDIEAASLAPYLQDMIKVKKLLSARIGFAADLKAKNNNLAAKCHVEFAPQARPDKQEPSSDIASDVLSLFSDDAGSMAFDFTINTKLDNPKLNSLNMKGIIGQAAVDNIASQPAENVIEKVKDTVEKFKDIGDSFKDIFKKKKE